MQFTFATASKILFATGAAQRIPELAGNLGSRPCLVTGANPKRAQWLVDGLTQTLCEPLVMPVSGEPDTEGAAEAAKAAREAGCDVVIGLGGGSVMDTAKVVAALITNTDDIYEYLEVVGKGNPLDKHPVPLITAPTTSGTGSEVTANGVLLSREHGVKVSLRSTEMIADMAVVDPQLAASMPPHVTAATGMDALTQLMEAFVTHKSTPMTDALCREGLMRAATSLPLAFEDGEDMSAREDMALASLLSGICLANAKLGAVHGFAAPIGGRSHAPHGAVCAALLPHVMEANLRALRERDPDSPSLHAYREVAVMLTADVTCEAEDGAAWVRELCEAMAIPTLGELGVKRDDFALLADQAAKASSMQGNPVELIRDELIGILEAAC
ncbi:MAG: iron-containing alcohol dehydrogenase [Pseudodesulfovibrio sp.]|jgi:alcohol dehydrogenase class IV|uniref:iron-containing alcohol dehydrogenase n=1 Tax=Pseudodesulfovibrio sp. TaxID=2035812 RepID=UPI003D0FEB97